MRHLPRAGALALALLSSCAWTADADDAGDESWVRMAIPTILGRKPTNLDEVRVLTHIAQTLGREAVADALLTQPEFTTYWTQVFIDDLQVDRAGTTRVNGACFGRPLLEEGAAADLIQHLSVANAGDRFCTTRSNRMANPGAGAAGSTAEAAPPPGADGAGGADGADGADGAGGADRSDGADADGGGSSDGTTEEAPLDTTELDFPFEEAWFNPSAHHGAYDDPTAPVATAPLGELPPPGTEDIDICPPFNMTDVLAAAIDQDELWPLYRAWLGPMSNFLHDSPTPDPINIKERGGAKWMETYTQRDTMCTQCHTTNFSTTDARPKNHGWDRFAEPQVDLEGAGFGWRLSSNKEVYGGDGNQAVRDHLRNFFRADQHTPPSDASSAIRPWGFDAACVTNNAAAWQGFYPTPPTPDPGSVAGMGGLLESSQYGVFDVADLYRDAALTWPSATSSSAPWDMTPIPETYLPFPYLMTPFERAKVLWEGGSLISGVPHQGCRTCHAIQSPATPPHPGTAPALGPILSRISNNRLIDIIHNGSSGGSMPGQGLNPADELLLLRYIRGNLRISGEVPYSPRPMFDNGAHALLGLLAQTIVHNVVAEVQGRGLVISHGFARNDETLALQEYLVEVMLGDWSLRSVLKEIVLSGAFNRKAPVDTTVGYVLPAVSNPWSEVYPASAEPADNSDANSVGDDVHRYSISNLLHSVHAALGWPAPGLGLLNAWPNAGLQRDMGRYYFSGERGIDEVDFASLLAWEAGVNGCEKPALVRRGDVDALPGAPTDLNQLIDPTQWEDWIDRLATAADGAYPLSEVVAALKERLMTSTEMTSGESDAIKLFLGTSDLATHFSHATHTPKLRALCGAMTKSPQFMLGGLAPPTGLPPSPPWRVCLEGEPCTETQICMAYKNHLSSIGIQYVCPYPDPLGDDG